MRSRMMGCRRRRACRPCRVLDADDGDDVARGDLFERDAVLGVHLEDAAGVLLLAVAGVEQAGALGELARVDADVGEVAVLSETTLKTRPRRGRRVVRAGHLGVLVAGVGALDSGFSVGLGR
jgi:hypothetical protein